MKCVVSGAERSDSETQRQAECRCECSSSGCEVGVVGPHLGSWPEGNVSAAGGRPGNGQDCRCRGCKPGEAGPSIRFCLAYVIGAREVGRRVCYVAGGLCARPGVYAFGVYGV